MCACFANVSNTKHLKHFSPVPERSESFGAAACHTIPAQVVGWYCNELIRQVSRFIGRKKDSEERDIGLKILGLMAQMYDEFDDVLNMWVHEKSRCERQRLN